MDGYRQLSQCCLTTTFILTQRTGAMKRIAGSKNQAAIERWLPGMLDGSLFGTVGISHLTTSRQHHSVPVLRATPISGNRYRLDGSTPWVTGAIYADVLVVGATLPNQEQLLVAIPRLLPGVDTCPPPSLLALSSSCTGQVNFDNVVVESEFILAGPCMEVMKQGTGAGTGGLQTSILAVGMADAAIEYLLQESNQRTDLQEIAEKLQKDSTELAFDLLQAADGNAACSANDLRQRANSLVLRSTQASPTAAKGAGFVQGHPAGRWATEALFFLVWSCPQPVLIANLCEFAGL